MPKPIVITAPNWIETDSLSIQYLKRPKLFLAGGITNCPEWQNDIINLLHDTNLMIFNPRRRNFPIDDPNAAREQITWEHQRLHNANLISFWFCKETLCPIVLYELGAWSMTDTPIFVGMDIQYQRKMDVEIQTRLARPEVKVVYDLEALTQQIKTYLNASPH